MAGLLGRHMLCSGVSTLSARSACAAARGVSARSIALWKQQETVPASKHNYISFCFDSSRRSSVRFMSSDASFRQNAQDAVTSGDETKLNAAIEQKSKEGGKHPADHHGGTVGLYKMPADEHHGDARSHLNPDGTSHWGLSSDHYHWYHPLAGTPQQLTVTVDGIKMLQGVETRPLDELYSVSQYNLPFWPRMRLNFWGNHSFGLKTEFLFFWIPTFIIASLAVPCLTMIYLNDEQISSTMTVKCIGRQWYWVYEVESPVDVDD